MGHSLALIVALIECFNSSLVISMTSPQQQSINQWFMVECLYLFLVARGGLQAKARWKKNVIHIEWMGSVITNRHSFIEHLPIIDMFQAAHLWANYLRGHFYYFHKGVFISDTEIAIPAYNRKGDNGLYIGALKQSFVNIKFYPFS